MKKRSLALFLAFLMVFAAVLPVFATEPGDEPEQEPEQEEEQNPTFTYADMYVQNGLQYRWDAYDLESIEGTDLTMTDKDGREVALTLADVVYNSEYKVPETVSPIDFSSLVPKGEKGEYLWNELEFELVMTQTSYTGSGEAGTSPYINLGPFAYQEGAGVGDGYKHASLPVPGWENGEAFNATYGGYAGIQLSVILTHETNKTAFEVNIPTRQTQLLYVQSFAGGELGRWYGNTLGQSYSLGAAMTFTLPEDSMAGVMHLVLFRDRLDARVSKEISGIPIWDISYIPGKTAIRTGTILDEGNAPTSYEQALEFASRDIAENIFVADIEGPDFRVGGVYGDSTALKVGYHAFRVYNRLLTDAERLQNHFADLCAYHQIDPEKAAAYVALDADSKAAIYSQKQFCQTADWFGPTSNANTSFDDVTKEQIEAAIDEQVLLVEAEKAAHNAKFEKLAGLYVEGYSALWSAYGAKSFFSGETAGVIAKGEGTEFTYAANEGGTAAYGDGYLRLVNGQLKVSGAYAGAPEEVDVPKSYTTEMIYATVDGNRTRDYGNGPKFEHEYGIIFGQMGYNVFTTWTVLESIIFTDATGLALHNAWASAFMAAMGDTALAAAFWTPISKTDYDAMIAAGQDANVRKVTPTEGATDAPIADYSRTGYEANYEGYLHVLFNLGRANYYHGYMTTSENTPGFGNSYVMKTDLTLNGYGWYQNPDFDKFGSTEGYWTRHDIGEVGSHTWTETIKNNGDGKYNYQNVIYGDNVEISKIGPANLATSKVTPTSNFIVNGFDADYYAIRIYPFLLDDAQKAQNHFADLANYVAIDNVDTFLELSEDSQKALYAQFAETTFADADKAVIEDAIKAAFLNELGVTAETFLAFEGYQMTVYTAPAMRATFSVKNPTVEGVELKEIGIGVAMGDFDPTNTIIYNGAEYTNTRTEGENVYASLTMSLGTSKAMLETEFTFSGYIVITYKGVDYTFNCDMTSVFGESVSMYELACHDALKDLDNAVAIRSIVEVEAE